MNGLYTNLLIRLRPESVAIPHPSVKMLSARPFCFYRLCIMKQRKLTPVGPEWIMKKKTIKWIGIEQSWEKKETKQGLYVIQPAMQNVPVRVLQTVQKIFSIFSPVCAFSSQRNMKYEGLLYSDNPQVFRMVGWGLFPPMHTHEHAWLDIQIMNVFLYKTSSRSHSVVTTSTSTSRHD